MKKLLSLSRLQKQSCAAVLGHVGIITNPGQVYSHGRPRKMIKRVYTAFILKFCNLNGMGLRLGSGISFVSLLCEYDRPSLNQGWYTSTDQWKRNQQTSIWLHRVDLQRERLSTRSAKFSKMIGNFASTIAPMVIEMTSWAYDIYWNSCYHVPQHMWIPGPVFCQTMLCVRHWIDIC